MAQNQIIPKKIGVMLTIVTALVLAGGLLYQFLLKDLEGLPDLKQQQEEVPTPTSTQEKPQEKSLAWGDRLSEVKTIVTSASSECAEIAIKQGTAIEIVKTADITGDGINEALVTNGCSGAYTRELLMLQFKNQDPALATFIDKQGKEILGQAFPEGSSVMNYEIVAVVPSLRVIYQAHGIVSQPPVCTVSWDIAAFQWNEDSQAFVEKDSVAAQVRRDYASEFPPYFDPVSGLSQTPSKDCELFQ